MAIQIGTSSKLELLKKMQCLTLVSRFFKTSSSDESTVVSMIEDDSQTQYDGKWRDKNEGRRQQ